MAKTSWKPGNMIYPLPAVMVTCRDKGQDNIITIAWTGTICTNPPMTYISVRPERHSYEMIKNSGEFVINLTTKQLTRATDFCGVRSGRDVDKFKEARLTKEEAQVVDAPIIAESPVNIECKVEKIVPLGSHHMFMAKVVNIMVDDDYMEDNGRFALEKTNPLIYSHSWNFLLRLLCKLHILHMVPHRLDVRSLLLSQGSWLLLSYQYLLSHKTDMHDQSAQSSSDSQASSQYDPDLLLH